MRPRRSSSGWHAAAGCAACAASPRGAGAGGGENLVRGGGRLNPAAVEALTRFGRLAADDDDLLDALATAELARRRDRGDGSLDWHVPPARAPGRPGLRPP